MATRDRHGRVVKARVVGDGDPVKDGLPTPAGEYGYRELGAGPNQAAPGTAATTLTTKGDLQGYSTDNARIPVGTDGYVLTADAAQATGVKWAAASSGTPSSSVVTETTYGQASTAGVATTYSRGDHTHGTPALPTPEAIGAAKLAGVAGGQTLIGGPNTGDDLTLRGSSAGGGVVNIADALGLRQMNRPVATFPLHAVAPNGNAVQGIGTTIAVSSGTTDVSDSTGLWQRLENGGFRTAAVLPAPGVWEVLVRTDPTSLANTWYYICLSATSPAGSDTPPNHSVGFMFRWGQDASNWHAYSRDGTTTNDEGAVAAITTAATYLVRIRYDGTNYYASVNGADEVTINANLPSGALGMCVYAHDSSGTHYLYWSACQRSYDWSG